MHDLKIDYVEFASADMAATRGFFAKAFDWMFVEYGDTYLDVQGAGIGGGVTSNGAGTAPLVILKADDLEAALEKVRDAGGEIVEPIFEFPGGRRFHFKEPGGNLMAVWSTK